MRSRASAGDVFLICTVSYSMGGADGANDLLLVGTSTGTYRTPRGHHNAKSHS